MGTGWYMCKIETIDGRIRVVTPCCACEVVDSKDISPAARGIIVNKMRWCKGTPVEDRCAAISGHWYNAYRKPSGNRQAVIKQEPADHDRPPGAVATLPRPQQRPYAATDIEAAVSRQLCPARPTSSHAGPIQADTQLDRDLDRIFGPPAVERRNYMRRPLPLSAQARERLSGDPP